MSTFLLNICCTCPDEDEDGNDKIYKYFCACPEVPVSCESIEKTAVMCGEVDPSGNPSTFFLEKKITGAVNRYIDGPSVSTTTFIRDGSGSCTNSTVNTGSETCQGYGSGPYYKKNITTFSPNPDAITGALGFGTVSGGSAVKTTTKSSSCVENTIYTSSPTTVTINGTNSDCGPGSLNMVQIFTGSGDLNFNNISGGWQGNITGHIREEECDGTFLDDGPYPFNVIVSSTQVNSFGDPLNQSGSEGTSYANPDTEENALAAATATSGTSCSSLYELRTDSSSFIKRTSTYSATVNNLMVGTEYTGCVKIRKRESYAGTPPAGANTDWEDVEPDTINTFTANSGEKKVANEVDIPHVQGYEYEVVSAHVWPTYSDCNCLSS